MTTDIIKATFTNLLFIMGVVLVIFGFVKGTLTVSQIIIFEKYPLASYEETRCGLDYSLAAPEGTFAENIKDKEERKTKCETSVEHERKVKMVQDIVSSISTFISGSVLVFFFRRFIFK